MELSSSDVAEGAEFACISFPLAGDAEKKKLDSPVFALAHAQATGLCDYTFESRTFL